MLGEAQIKEQKFRFTNKKLRLTYSGILDYQTKEFIQDLRKDTIYSA
mgnify:CR=1 FL=1